MKAPKALTSTHPRVRPAIGVAEKTGSRVNASEMRSCTGPKIRVIKGRLSAKYSAATMALTAIFRTVLFLIFSFPFVVCF